MKDFPVELQYTILQFMEPKELFCTWKLVSRHFHALLSEDVFNIEELNNRVAQRSQFFLSVFMNNFTRYGKFVHYSQDKSDHFSKQKYEKIVKNSHEDQIKAETTHENNDHYEEQYKNGKKDSCVIKYSFLIKNTLLELLSELHALKNKYKSKIHLLDHAKLETKIIFGVQKRYERFVFNIYRGELSSIADKSDSSNADNFQMHKLHSLHPLSIQIPTNSSESSVYLLHVIAKNNDIPTLQAILSHFSLRNILIFGNNLLYSSSGHSPLHSAAYWGSLDYIQYTVENVLHYIKEKDPSCANLNNISSTIIIHDLLYSKEKNFGQNILHIACASRNVSVVDYLINVCSMDVNLSDHDGFTPLHIAILKNSQEICRLLLDAGAKKNAVGLMMSPIEYCTLRQNTKLIKLFDKYP